MTHSRGAHSEFVAVVALASTLAALGCGDKVIEGRYEPLDPEVAAIAAPLGAAHEAINAIRGEADFGPASFADIEAVWIADLQAAVAAAEAGHSFVSEGSNLGEALAADIEAALVAGAADMNVGAQGQILDKVLQRFFVESMAGALLADTEEGWDRAFSFYGRSEDGATSTMIAKTAAKRDENFGTSYNDDIWNAFIDGRNAIVTDDHDAFHEAEELIDLAVLEVFALSGQREFRQMEDTEVIADLDEHEEKALEGIVFWETIRDHAATLDSTGATAVDAAISTMDPRDPASFDGVAVADQILAIYGLGL